MFLRVGEVCWSTAATPRPEEIREVWGTKNSGRVAWQTGGLTNVLKYMWKKVNPHHLKKKITWWTGLSRMTFLLQHPPSLFVHLNKHKRFTTYRCTQTLWWELTKTPKKKRRIRSFLYQGHYSKITCLSITVRSCTFSCGWILIWACKHRRAHTLHIIQTGVCYV